jgi:hypothetical protein
LLVVGEELVVVEAHDGASFADRDQSIEKVHGAVKN